MLKECFPTTLSANEDLIIEASLHNLSRWWNVWNSHFTVLVCYLPPLLVALLSKFSSLLPPYAKRSHSFLSLPAEGSSSLSFLFPLAFPHPPKNLSVFSYQLHLNVILAHFHIFIIYIYGWTQLSRVLELWLSLLNTMLFKGLKLPYPRMKIVCCESPSKNQTSQCTAERGCVGGLCLQGALIAGLWRLWPGRLEIVVQGNGGARHLINRWLVVGGNSWVYTVPGTVVPN